MPTDMTLWSWKLSPFAGRVRITLAEKGVEVAMVEIDPANRPAELKALNPTATVPVLVVDGTPLRESTAIVEYLEEIYPEPPLWPADPLQRAYARGLTRWIDDEVNVNYFLGFRKAAFGAGPGDAPDISEVLHGRVAKRWKRLEEILGRHDGPWVLGEQFTHCDVAAMPLSVRLPQWKPEMQPDVAEYPTVGAWLDALRSRPSIGAVKAAGEPLAA